MIYSIRMSNKITTIDFFKRDDITEKFREILGKRSTSFLTSVMSVISSNEMLKNADTKSLYLSVMTSATLDLPINQNLWFAYIIPYKTKDGVVAQFQIWYKGIIQLALRSWQFKTISATPVYEWQLVSVNPLNWYEFDWTVEKKWNPIWYASYFSLLNWFEKYLYMSMDEMKNHWLKFSQSFKKWFGVRTEDFDSMAQKTVLKLLLSKYAPLSVDMQKAIISDQWVINDENLDDIEYIDNDQSEIIDVDIEEKMKEFKPLDDNKKE